MWDGTLTICELQALRKYFEIYQLHAYNCQGKFTIRGTDDTTNGPRLLIV